MELLHPGARWIFRFRGYVSMIFLVIFLTFFSFSAINIIGNTNTSIIFSILIAIFLVIILVEIYARMSYNRWKYEFTHTNLKLERGIIWKRYSNVPYERVQNVDINRGIIARIFGFSTVNIQTAGLSYGGRHGTGAEGHIPAVEIERAEQIRDFLMKKISHHSREGL